MTNHNQSLTMELQQIEQAITQADTLRQRAIMRKDMLEQQLKEAEDELKGLGTTPEKAKDDLARIDADIQAKLKEIHEQMPYDLIKKYEGYI